MLLSGIGPAAQSQALGITPVVDSPDVGQNLQDHPLLGTNYKVSSTDTLDNLVTNTTLQAEQLALWQQNRTGKFTLGVCNQWIWERLPDDDAIFNTVDDPSAGPTAPHYQLIFSVGTALSSAVAHCEPWSLNAQLAISRIYTLTSAVAARPLRPATISPC